MKLHSKIAEQLKATGFSRDPRSLFLTPVTAEELKTLSQKLRNKFTSADNEIPTNLIKTCMDEVDEVLSYIINNSFT